MSATLFAARLTVLLLAMSLAAVSWIFSAPPQAASALAPVQTAWWNVANLPGAPPVPPPSDVDTTKHDLYIQGAGGTAGPAPAPVPQMNNAQGGAQDIAAVQYDIPDGAEVQQLTLKITGNKPPGTPTATACVITQPAFHPEDNGPESDIPKYDCGTQSAGALNSAGDALVFKDIGKLVKGTTLMFVLVPGQVDRVVLAHPDDSALEVSSGYSSLPPVAEPATLPDYSSSGVDNSSAAASQSFTPPEAAAAPPVGEPPLPAPLPTKAPSTGARRVVAAAPAVVSRLPLSPQATRLVVGAASLASIAAFAAMVLLGPRMTTSSALAGEALAGRGVGRFVRERSGPPPRIW